MNTKDSRHPDRHRIAVTANDIDHAVRSHSTFCAVAAALGRAIPGAHHIEVDLQAIRFTLGDERFMYLTPVLAQNYVIDYDAGRPIKPFQFQLRESRLVRIKHTQLNANGRTVQRAVKAAAARALKTGADPRVAGQQARQEVVAQMTSPSGERPRLTETTPDLPRMPPRIFRHQRLYGMRALRINQDNATRFVDDAGNMVRPENLTEPSTA